MNQMSSIQRVTDQLGRIEAEITAIRRELITLRQRQNDTAVPYPWVNKTTLGETMQKLFLTLAIEGKSIGAERLQEKMKAANLTTNELSHSIIGAREE